MAKNYVLSVSMCRQELVDVVTKIRASRGSLSGLGIDQILERADAFIRKPKVCMCDRRRGFMVLSLSG